MEHDCGRRHAAAHTDEWLALVDVSMGDEIGERDTRP